MFLDIVISINVTDTIVNNIIVFVVIHYTSLIKVPTVKCFPYPQVFRL